MRRALGLVLASWLLAPTGCISTGNPEITRHDLMRHVRELADDSFEGRRSGTPGGTRAARYIAREFRRSGLIPPGDWDDYQQQFQVTVERRLGRGNRLEIRAPRWALDLEVERDYLPFGNSASADITGRLVFAGYGITSRAHGYDDYAGLDVDGCLVLILSGEPRADEPEGPLGAIRPSPRAHVWAKLLNAASRGAAAILCAGAPGDRDGDGLALARRFGGSSAAGMPILGISSEAAARIFASVGCDASAISRSIDRTLERPDVPFDEVMVRVETDLMPRKRPATNVVGLVRGRDPGLRDEWIVVGAHYDHIGLGRESSRAPTRTGEIHNGADDNASGTAALLELAQHLSARRRELRRSVLFVAFGAEESGLIGSREFLRQTPVPLGRTIAMINMDMLGRLREGRFNIEGVATGSSFREILDGIDDQWDLQWESSPAGSPGGSDHFMFLLRRIPSLFVTTGLHDEYHTPDDDASTINGSGLERVTRAVADIVRALDRAEERPRFVSER